MSVRTKLIVLLSIFVTAVGFSIAAQTTTDESLIAKLQTATLGTDQEAFSTSRDQRLLSLNKQLDSMQEQATSHVNHLLSSEGITALRLKTGCYTNFDCIVVENAVHLLSSHTIEELDSAFAELKNTTLLSEFFIGEAISWNLIGSAEDLNRLSMVDQILRGSRWALVDQLSPIENSVFSAHQTILTASFDLYSASVIDQMGEDELLRAMQDQKLSRLLNVLALHASRTPTLQIFILQKYEVLREDHKHLLRSYAFLADKVGLRLGQGQIYGTQFGCIQGVFTAVDLNNIETVEVRREEVGLEPLEEYRKKVGSRPCN